MLTIKELKFAYSDNTFSICLPDIKINQGDSVAVYGPSGTGKSTFLNLLAGSILADSGSITFNDQNYSKLSKSALKSLRLNEFGIVFQQPELVDWMSVKDNILLPRKLSKKSIDNKHFSTLTEKVEISQLLSKDAGRLSVGEKMRTSIVRALLGRPNLILADEPTASLDPKLRQQMINLLLEESKESGSTLIIVSHDESVTSKMDKKLSSENWEFQ